MAIIHFVVMNADIVTLFKKSWFAVARNVYRIKLMFLCTIYASVYFFRICFQMSVNHIYVTYILIVNI